MLQTADTVLLIRPSHFGFNPETAASNSFQQAGVLHGIREKAIIEFNAFADKLQRENIGTIIFDDQPKAETPDAVFPNNWISFHSNGKVVLYPMESPSRRRERRMDLVEKLQEQYGYEIQDIVDLTSHENQGKYLEGTGSIVFDHLHKIAYMAQSSRSNSAVLEELCEQLQYHPFTFNTAFISGLPIYHTNVLMTLGSKFAAVCGEVIEGKNALVKLLDTLEQSNRNVVEITANQMAAFAGNMLEVRNKNGDPFLILSETAIKSLENNQKRMLEQFATLLPASIPTIEKHGGGSVRCMMAEVFLPKKSVSGNFIIRSPKTADEFEQYFALRWKVLRAPWNQPQGSEQDNQEETSHHFAGFKNGKVISVGRVQSLDSKTMQVRYMAVDPEFHGQGIGKKMMKAMEEFAIAKGYSRIFLQARENAVPFYQANGYGVIEQTYVLFDVIQHFSMEKRFK